MPQIPLLQDTAEVTTLPELIEHVQSIAEDYSGVTLNGSFAHTDIISSSTGSTEFLEADNWVNLLLVAIFETDDREEAFDIKVERDPFIVFNAFLGVDEFIAILQQLADDRQATLGGYDVRFRAADYEEWDVSMSHRTSNSQRYDDLDRHFPTYVFDLSNPFGDLRINRISIDKGTVPGGLGLEQEDPPLLNIHDAVEEYVGFDTRSGHHGKFYIFQPYYDHRITDTTLHQDTTELEIELDRYHGPVNDDTDLTLQIISSVAEAHGDVRINHDVTSHHEIIDLATIPNVLYILLSHHDTVVDMRRLGRKTRSTPLLDTVHERKETQPFLAAAAARMALLNHLRQMCAANGIPYRESEDEVPDLARKLFNHSIIRGYERGQIENTWYDILSKAVHLRKSDVTEREIQRTIDTVTQYISERPLTTTDEDHEEYTPEF